MSVVQRFIKMGAVPSSRVLVATTFVSPCPHIDLTLYAHCPVDATRLGPYFSLISEDTGYRLAPA
jgi:hypothetical protein